MGRIKKAITHNDTGETNKRIRRFSLVSASAIFPLLPELQLESVLHFTIAQLEPVQY
jgi:hypothetical protein